MYVKYPTKKAGSLEALCSTRPISSHVVNIKAQLKMYIFPMNRQ